MRSTRIHGFLPGDILELSYGERHSGEFGDVAVDPDETKFYYMSTGTQFFPVAEVKHAIAAFFERMNSDKPWKDSVIFKGFMLEQCLKEDPNELTLLEVK